MGNSFTTLLDVGYTTSFASSTKNTTLLNILGSIFILIALFGLYGDYTTSEQNNTEFKLSWGWTIAPLLIGIIS